MAPKVLLTSARPVEVSPPPAGLPLRVRRRTFALDLLAENLAAPVLLLDRPEPADLARLLERERFDLVVIHLHPEDLGRARELARLVRLVQPWARVLLAGPGAAREGVEERLECDGALEGDGVAGLREAVGEDPAAGVRLPAIVAATLSSATGRRELGLLVAGAGEGRERRRYFADGAALVREALRVSDQLGTDLFLVPDEGLLADPQLVREALSAMEQAGRPLEFVVQARAADLERYAPEELVRLGVFGVLLAPDRWGPEHAGLVAALRAHGIVVQAGCPLPPGDPEEALAAALRLQADATVFTPAPVDLEDAADPGPPAPALAQARARVDAEHGALLLRIARTLLQGYRAFEFSDDPWIRHRAARLQVRAEELRLLLDRARGEPGPEERALREEFEREFARMLGPRMPGSRALVLRAAAVRELRTMMRRVGRALDTSEGRLRHYRWGADPLRPPRRLPPKRKPS